MTTEQIRPAKIRAPKATKLTPDQVIERRADGYDAADRVAAERDARKVAELATQPVPVNATWVFDSVTGARVGYATQYGVVPLPAEQPTAAPAPVVIIPCGGRKAAGLLPAGEKYIGSYHQMTRKAAAAIAERTGARVLILSALYGLLELDDLVDDYDLQMGQPGSVVAGRVAEQAARLGITDALVTVIAGKAYANVVTAVWPHAVRVLDGTNGMPHQMKRMSEITRGEWSPNRATAAAVFALFGADLVAPPALELARAADLRRGDVLAPGTFGVAGADPVLVTATPVGASDEVALMVRPLTFPGRGKHVAVPADYGVDVTGHDTLPASIATAAAEYPLPPLAEAERVALVEQSTAGELECGPVVDDLGGRVEIQRGDVLTVSLMSGVDVSLAWRADEGDYRVTVLQHGTAKLVERARRFDDEQLARQHARGMVTSYRTTGEQVVTRLDTSNRLTPEPEGADMPIAAPAELTAHQYVSGPGRQCGTSGCGRGPSARLHRVSEWLPIAPDTPNPVPGTDTVGDVPNAQLALIGEPAELREQPTPADSASPAITVSDARSPYARPDLHTDALPIPLPTGSAADLVVDAGSICVGYGGLELGVTAAIQAAAARHGTAVALKHRWFAEYNPAAATVLRAHWPDVPNIDPGGDAQVGDVTRIDWTTLPRVKVYAGGIPCQPYSTDGTRQGSLDERDLWPVRKIDADGNRRRGMLDGIRAMRPPLVIIENVEGLLRGDQGDAFGTILADLHAEDYRVSWTTVGACKVGACHCRHRVFIVATTAPVDAPDDALFPVPLQSMGKGRWPASGLMSDGWIWELPADTCGKTSGAALFPGSTALERLSPAEVAAWLAPHHDRTVPTVRAVDGDGGPGKGKTRTGGINLRTAAAEVMKDGLGPYERAVRRQEALFGATAPAPARQSARGNWSLDAPFAEWMMGVPAGWITGQLERGPAIGRAGNGVVWQASAHGLLTLPTFHAGVAELVDAYAAAPAS
jgi:DNA (cytosine-5)-methyltransferase 1